jgi:hypothetical protein
MVHSHGQPFYITRIQCQVLVKRTYPIRQQGTYGAVVWIEQREASPETDCYNIHEILLKVA